MFEAQAGRERRETFGVRLYGASRTWQYDFEAIGQTGSFEHRRISAWAVSGLVGHLAFAESQLPIGMTLGADAISGDRLFGEPISLEAVAQLPCLVFGSPGEARWHCGPPGEPPLGVQPVFVADDLDVLRQVALSGIGFALLPRFVVCREIEAGSLRVLAFSADLTPVDVHAVYPGHAIPSPAARALADHLQRGMTGSPHWIT